MTKNEIDALIEKGLKQPIWGNWYIKEKIGSGSFSAVYRAEAVRINRTDSAALKIEPITDDGKLFLDEERRRSYIDRKRLAVESESTIMYRLKNCPYVVSYEEEDMQEINIDGKFEGYYFLIRMELLTCIYDKIKNRQMDFSEKNIMKMARDIARGIKAAHEIGVIHRDIKPSNFFVSEHGTYKLGDFNVSKKTDFAKTFAGTDGYLAPEIYAAKADADSHYTNQADIYSFGICLYQLMNDLYFPFEKEYDNDTAFDMRMKGTPLPPPTRASQAFARIILKSCEFSEKSRYRNMDEFLKDLDIAEGRIAIAPTPQPPPPVQRNIPTNQPAANPIPRNAPMRQNPSEIRKPIPPPQNPPSQGMYRNMPSNPPSTYNTPYIPPPPPSNQPVNYGFPPAPANGIMNLGVQNNQNKRITREEFIHMLMKCFEGFYYDMHVIKFIYCMDSPMYRGKWYSGALAEIKKYYSSRISVGEHIFLVKPTASSLFKGELDAGFTLTDQNIYFSYRSDQSIIPVNDIIEFEPQYRPSKNGYVLNVKYIFNKQEWLRSLVSYDKRIVKFCDKLNEFLKIYHECYPLIDPNRFY